jgi:hypothetical protein
MKKSIFATETQRHRVFMTWGNNIIIFVRASIEKNIKI